jgi:hypothetical protein
MEISLGVGRRDVVSLQPRYASLQRSPERTRIRAAGHTRSATRTREQGASKSQSTRDQGIAVISTTCEVQKSRLLCKTVTHFTAHADPCPLGQTSMHRVAHQDRHQTTSDIRSSQFSEQTGLWQSFVLQLLQIFPHQTQAESQLRSNLVWTQIGSCQNVPGPELRCTIQYKRPKKE